MLRKPGHLARIQTLPVLPTVDLYDRTTFFSSDDSLVKLWNILVKSSYRTGDLVDSFLFEGGV